VLECPIDLVPGRLATVRVGATDDEIGRRPGERMEQRIVCATDGAPEMCLRGAPVTCCCKVSSNLDEVTRLQLSDPSHPPSRGMTREESAAHQAG
jgi:hypothetical protein